MLAEFCDRWEARAGHHRSKMRPWRMPMEMASLLVAAPSFPRIDAREISSGTAFHEFEAVAEGVENMETAKAAKRNVGLDGSARGFAAREKLIEAFDHQRGMSFLRGMKILFHA